jgi:hypothetical protein
MDNIHRREERAYVTPSAPGGVTYNKFIIREKNLQCKFSPANEHKTRDETGKKLYSTHTFCTYTAAFALCVHVDFIASLNSFITLISENHRSLTQTHTVQKRLHTYVHTDTRASERNVAEISR